LLVQPDFAQDSSKVESFVFRCYLKNEANKKSVGFAHIYNESRKFGVISDSSGYFITNVKEGDTIVCMALGYLGKLHIISLKDTNTTTIYLTTRSYQIDEVSLSIPRTYKEFKEAFMEVEVDKNRPMAELPQHNPYKTPQLLDTNIISTPGFFIFHPVSALYLKYNKEEKSKRKVWYMQQQELKQSIVDEKYNREMVSELTGFKDYELTNFMGWCNFSFNYLYELSPLEIRRLTDSKYKEYLNCCYNGEKLNSNSNGN
jgi:hypothetical protein